MNDNKASKLRFYWIAFMTGVYTVWTCLNIILSAMFYKKHRQFIDKVLFNWSINLLKLIQVKVKTVGLERFPRQSDRPIVVMCNHSSLYDIPISVIALKTSLRMLTKSELYKIPIMGAALRGGEFVSIDRKNREQSMKDLEVAKEKMASGIILWVAPEGTRSRNGKLAKFKRGGFHLALDTKALIVPIVIKDIHKVQGGTNLELRLNQEIEVEICEPIDTIDFSSNERKELVNKVRQRMLVALNQTDG